MIRYLGDRNYFGYFGDRKYFGYFGDNKYFGYFGDRMIKYAGWKMHHAGH